MLDCDMPEIKRYLFCKNVPSTHHDELQGDYPYEMEVVKRWAAKQKVKVSTHIIVRPYDSKNSIGFDGNSVFCSPFNPKKSYCRVIV